MKITAEIVAHIADLASLQLDAEESRRMQADLDAILGWVEKLSELDTTDVPPTAHVIEMATPMRRDEVADVLPVDEALRNAPRHDDGSMIVPKVID